MRALSATIAITRAVTVAERDFGPGQHLGELTQYFPSGLVVDVLAQTGTMLRRAACERDYLNWDLAPIS